ncbi:MAG: hypothetical protein E7D34_08215 [Klebsiella sp.]|nr:hypothetical protein [Klebsiella sp.]
MKELSIMEMDYVSGAADTPGWGTGYIWDSLSPTISFRQVQV